MAALKLLPDSSASEPRQELQLLDNKSQGLSSLCSTVNARLWREERAAVLTHISTMSSMSGNKTKYIHSMKCCFASRRLVKTHSLYGGTTNTKSVRVCASPRAHIHGRERTGNAQLVVAAGVLPASVPLSPSTLVFGRRGRILIWPLLWFQSPSRDREAAQMRIGLRIFESSQLHRGESSWHLQSCHPQSSEASPPPMAAHRHPWAAGLVPDPSPIDVP